MLKRIFNFVHQEGNGCYVIRSQRQKLMFECKVEEFKTPRKEGVNDFMKEEDMTSVKDVVDHTNPSF